MITGSSIASRTQRHVDMTLDGLWVRKCCCCVTNMHCGAHTGPPKVLHYGNDLKLENTSYAFSKVALRTQNFDGTVCPPWDTPIRGGLLPRPPSPLVLETMVRQRGRLISPQEHTVSLHQTRPGSYRKAFLQILGNSIRNISNRCSCGSLLPTRI